MIFQQFNLVPRLDVLTNVLMGRLSYQPTARSLLKLFTPQERALAVVTLDRVEMAPFDPAARRQSVGRPAAARRDRPRAGAGAAILLADEPIASLDPRSAARVMDILRSINREDGITVICNLHTIDTARAYCDRIIGMRTGKMVFDGPAEGARPRADSGNLRRGRRRGDRRKRHLDGAAGRSAADCRELKREFGRRQQRDSKEAGKWEERNMRPGQDSGQLRPGDGRKPARRARAPRAQDWRKQFPKFRYGVQAVETQAAALTRYKGFGEYVKQKLGVELELFLSAEYAGVIQAIGAKQLEVMDMGASGYAAA